MWLILSEPCDPAATWLAGGLRSCTPLPVVHFTSSDIGPSACSERGVDGAGVWFSIRTAGGRAIHSRELRGVVNRIWALPPGLAMRMNLPDRRPIVRNIVAPLLRWLHRFPGPVLNRPTAQGLSGDFRLPNEWVALAEESGFFNLPQMSAWREEACPGPEPAAADEVTRVVVVGAQVLSLDDPGRAVPGALAARCLRLASVARASLLGIDAVRVFPRDWRFAGATFWPDLTRGGTALLDAVAGALRVTAAAPADGELDAPPAPPTVGSGGVSIVL